MATKYSPSTASPPGSTLKEMLEERKISIADFAERIGLSYAQLESIIIGDGEITPELAEKFEKEGLDLQRFWLSRERNYRNFLLLYGKGN